MDKFTIYDFMSYFLPGVVALFVIRIFIHLDYSLLQINTLVEQSLAFSIVAILLGLFNHRLTFWLLNFKWYRKIIMSPIKILIKENREDLKDDYNKLRLLLNEHDEGKLFDKAYHYLEFKDRISSAKGFQSMYFFIRNLITLSLVIFFTSIIIFFINNLVDKKIFLTLFIACPICISILIWMGKWYREKLIIKVYKTCIIALTIEKITPKNDD